MERDEWQKFCEKISELGKYLEDEGMPLAYHHHMGTVIETQKDTERLIENTHESVKINIRYRTYVICKRRLKIYITKLL